MKGLSLEEYVEVMEFLKKYHSFANYINPEEKEKIKKEFPQMPEYGYNIKYVDSCYDSRTHTIWSITFRVGVAKLNFRTNQFALTESPKAARGYETIYEMCMAFMKGEFDPPKEYFITKEN